MSDDAHVKIALRDAASKVYPVADKAHARNALARAAKSQIVPMRAAEEKKRAVFLRDDVAPVLSKLHDMSWQQRLWFLEAVKDAFCVHCGDSGGTDACYCRRDD